MAKNQIDKFNFKIAGVELISSELYGLPEGMTNITGFNFDVNVNPKIDATRKLVMVGVEVRIRSTDNLDILLGKLLAACLFEIENFEECVEQLANNTFDIDDKMLEIFTSVSVSTVRGIMFSEFRGTVLHQAYLPIVDPKTFFKKQQPKE